MTIHFGSKTFATPTVTSFAPVRFAVITDIHLDIKYSDHKEMSSVNSKDMLRTVAGLNREKDLDFVMLTGDLLWNGEVENAREIKRHLTQLTVPYYVLAGNHDYAPVNPEKRREGITYMTIEEFVHFFNGHGYDNSGERYYAFQIKPGLRLIGLDGCLPQEAEKWGGILPDRQLRWLNKQLTEHSKALNLIFLHHNFVRWDADELSEGSKSWYALDNDEAARKVLAKHVHAAPVAISGHRHIDFNYQEEDEVTYFVIPPLNSPPMRFTIFSISNEAITWETVMVDVIDPSPLRTGESTHPRTPSLFRKT
jgi:3',5'-cyclic-AMP phosphodiesterase